VFVAKDKDMWAFALKGKARPTAETKLFHVPMMNVWENGKVCTGSVPLPSSTVAQSIKEWEDAFWNSHFTHPNHKRPVRYKGGIHAFCIDLLDGKFKEFPVRVLNAIPNATLGALVERLDKENDA
jgi:PRTRC genetic system protein B